jgi:hypothetical protein
MKNFIEQFEDLKRTYSDATLLPIMGVHQIYIPQITLPTGWSQTHAEVRFIVPNGYPYAPPDFFWADLNLRLRNGRLPQNAQIGTPMPGHDDPNTLWFSWHVSGNWKLGFCDLLTYVKIIRNRLEERK